MECHPYFITNTAVQVPHGGYILYTCPHKEDYDITLSHGGLYYALVLNQRLSQDQRCEDDGEDDGDDNGEDEDGRCNYYHYFAFSEVNRTAEDRVHWNLVFVYS